VLASDSLSSANGKYSGHVVKVERINGWLIGVSGMCGVAREFFAWFEENCKDEKLRRPPSTLLVDDDKNPISVLLVSNKTGAVYMIDGLGYPFRVHGKFFAIGSGESHAMGAMAAGADAIKAVRIAITFDCYTGGPVRVLKRAS